MDDKALFRMKKARTALLTGHPFFGACSMRLAMQETDKLKGMGVDGKTLAFNPAWVRAQSFDVLKGAVAHEVLHCIAGHHARRGRRDPKLWNQACDFAINPILATAGFKLWADALNRPDFEGKSAEEIYSRLKHEQQAGNKPGDKDAQGAAGEQEQPGEVMDAPAPDGSPQASPADLSDARAEWEIASLMAESVAKKRGHGSSFAEGILDGIKNPRVPWAEVMREFFTSTAQADLTWSRPNRRFFTLGFYLPSLHSEAMGDIVVAIDTSGSCSHAQEAFTAEMQAIVGDCDPERVHFVYCDSAVQKVVTFERGEPIELTRVRGGGTDFRPVFDWVDEQGLQPSALVYLTDLAGAFPGMAPDYPVLWATVDPGAAPFGDVIHVDH